MRPRPLSEIARVVEGTLEGDDVEVRSVSTDSRAVEAGGVFVALPGERTDGHRFVATAFAAGAAAAIVGERESGSLGPMGPLVHVSSTPEALLRLAADERGAMDATVVGITGANGKTSTKDLTDAVARSRLPRPFQPRVVQQRDRAAPDAAGRAAGHAGPRRRDGSAASGGREAPLRDRPPRRRRGHERRRRAHGDLRIVGLDRGSVRRTDRRPRRGRCCRPQRRRPGRDRLRGPERGDGPDVRDAIGGRRARGRRLPRPGGACLVPGVDPRRGGTGAARGARRAHGVERARGAGGGPGDRRLPRGRGRGVGGCRHLPLADGVVHQRSGRARAERRVQRQPGVDGRRPARPRDGSRRTIV